MYTTEENIFYDTCSFYINNFKALSLSSSVVVVVVVRRQLFN